MAERRIDLSEFDNAVRIKGPVCTVRTAIERLSEDRAEKVQAAFESDLTNRAIAERLSDWSGMTVRFGTVGRHRRGDCACG